MRGLIKLHEFAAGRGEGLRPEFLRLLRTFPEVGVMPPPALAEAKEVSDDMTHGHGQHVWGASQLIAAMLRGANSRASR